jgi:Flp pilus assembly protein TadG
MKKNERGQSLVIIAISFLALVAMAALIIDGGSLYLNRRNAQTAADAAALAGARELCVNKGNDSAVQNIVTQYAITENGATQLVENPTINRPNNTNPNYSVTVKVMLETSSFFAGILGIENNTVQAEASAGCFSPGTAENVLPVAWTCQPPVSGEPVKNDCTIRYKIPKEVFVKDLLPRLKSDPDLLLDEDTEKNSQWLSYMNKIGNKIAYIVMDSDKFDEKTCKPPIGTGIINCDFDGDGVRDISAGGDRGWLYLTDDNGASGISDVIYGIKKTNIELPQWFVGKPGGTTSEYKAIYDIKYKIVLIPIVNAVCPNAPKTCPTEFKTGDIIHDTKTKNKPQYRVDSFAAFVITCESKNSLPCPARNFAGLGKKDKDSIEGYFIDGYVAGTNIDPGGSDLGVYIISLTK